MRFIKIERKDWSLLFVLDLKHFSDLIVFKNIYKRLKKIDKDTYRLIF